MNLLHPSLVVPDGTPPDWYERPVVARTEENRPGFSVLLRLPDGTRLGACPNPSQLHVFRLRFFLPWTLARLDLHAWGCGPDAYAGDRRDVRDAVLTEGFRSVMGRAESLGQVRVLLTGGVNFAAAGMRTPDVMEMRRAMSGV